MAQDGVEPIETKTSAYVTYVDTSLLLKLPVDIFIFYPLNESNWTEMERTFHDVTVEGREVYLVLGKDVNATFNQTQVEDEIGNIGNIIERFRENVSGFVMWDDPLDKGGVNIRNRIMGELRLKFTEEEFILALDLAPCVCNLTKMDELKMFELDSYAGILGYFYSWFDSSKWPDKSLVRTLQGGIDPGYLRNLIVAVDLVVDLCDNSKTAWFIHNAHSFGDLTITTTQMAHELEISKLAGIPNIGWFTMDLIPKGGYVDTEYIGTGTAFDVWIRYEYLRWVLIPRARDDRITNLGLVIQYISGKLDSVNSSLTTDIGESFRSLARVTNDNITEVQGLIRLVNNTLVNENRSTNVRIDSLDSTLGETNTSLNTSINQLSQTLIETNSSLFKHIDDLNLTILSIEKSLNRSIKDLSNSTNERIAWLNETSIIPLMNETRTKLSNLTMIIDDLSKKIALQADNMSDDFIDLRDLINQKETGIEEQIQELDNSLKNGLGHAGNRRVKIETEINSADTKIQGMEERISYLNSRITLLSMLFSIMTSVTMGMGLFAIIIVSRRKG